MASSITHCGIADHASTNRCFSSLTSLIGDLYMCSCINLRPCSQLGSDLDCWGASPQIWINESGCRSLFHMHGVPAYCPAIRQSVVPVSLSLRSSLFNNRIFQSLDGNSLINRFAPQPFNMYNSEKMVRSSSLKTSIFTKKRVVSYYRNNV